jgi:hypothetical protein
MLSLSNPMKFEEYITDFPIERMPWFQKLHGNAEVGQCTTALQNNWYLMDNQVRAWHRRSGGQDFGQQYTIFPCFKHDGVSLDVQLQAPECIPPPLRNYQPDAMRSCAVINSLKADMRRVLADTLCIEAIQNIEMARSTLFQPGGEVSAHQENRNAILAFMRRLKGQSYTEMSAKIRTWEDHLRERYAIMIDGCMSPE